MAIARVFCRKTNACPTDELAFFGEPTIADIATCHANNVEEIHISCTFAYDLQRAEDLYFAWQIVGVPVEVGGPAFDDRMGDFVPGRYLKDGYIFTSRGCTKDCWFCSVPRCAHGVVKELPIVDGYNIMDDNIIATSREHFTAVCEMLKRQEKKAIFTGGLEASMLQRWQAELLAEVKPQRMYFAYDTKDDLEPLIAAGKMLDDVGIKAERHTRMCYVLIGYEGDSYDDATKRMEQTMDAGFMPFAMLYRDENGIVKPDWKGFQREWANAFIVGGRFSKWSGRTSDEAD